MSLLEFKTRLVANNKKPWVSFLLAIAPISDENEQIFDINNVICVEISKDTRRSPFSKKDQEVINIDRSVISKVCNALALVWDFITVDFQTCAICNIEYIINTVSVAIDCKKITLNYSNNLLSSFTVPPARPVVQHENRDS